MNILEKARAAACLRVDYEHHVILMLALELLEDIAEAAAECSLTCPHVNHAPNFTLCPEERLKRLLARLEKH